MNDDELKDMTEREYRVGPASFPSAALAEELSRERMLEAQNMSPEEKFLAGEELFEWACSITLAGIRDENPGRSDSEYLQILEDRLAMRERLEKSS